MAFGALLKDSRLVEGPVLCLRRRPVGMAAEQRDDLTKIRFVVRSEKELRAGLRASRHVREKFTFHDAVLVVAPLGPGIREKDENRGEARGFRHRGNEILRVCTHEGQIAEATTVTLSVRAHDPIGSDINSDAGLLRIGRCVGRQEVAVAAPDFPYKVCLGWDQLCECATQFVTPLRQMGRVFG